jgi:hypothetical protein
MEDIYYELSSFAEEFHGNYDGFERPVDEGDYEKLDDHRVP